MELSLSNVDEEEKQEKASNEKVRARGRKRAQSRERRGRMGRWLGCCGGKRRRIRWARRKSSGQGWLARVTFYFENSLL
jgi:hypothetical protein